MDVEELTTTVEGGVEAAGEATIVPLHYEGWKHFSESRDEIEKGYAEAGLQPQTKVTESGQRVAVEP